MKRVAVCVTLSALFLAALVAGDAAAQPAAKEKPVQWTVVQVDDDFQAIEKGNFKDFQKGIADKYAADRKSWEQAKKEAAKNKEKFTEPPPKRPKVKPTNKTFKTEEEASDFVAKMREELEKKKKPTRP